MTTTDSEREAITAIAHLALMSSGHASALLDSGLEYPFQEPVHYAEQLLLQVHKALRESLKNEKALMKKRNRYLRSVIREDLTDNKVLEFRQKGLTKPTLP